MTIQPAPLRATILLCLGLVISTFNGCKKDEDKEIPQPTISSFMPQGAAIGETITITGTNFSPVTAENSVTINNVAAQVTTSTATEIKALIASGTTSGKVKVSVRNNTVTSGTDLMILGLVSTLAGNGTEGYADGTGIQARLKNPTDVALDADENLYVTDANFRIRKITPGGVVTTYAGSGGNDLVDGPAATAEFSIIVGLGLDKQNNVYVADLGNQSIRKITTAGIVSTVAGQRLPGFVNGDVSIASFFLPADIAVGANGDLYIADAGNNCIRRISNGMVTTFAGTTGVAGFVDGSASVAKFSQPWKLAFDPAGNLIVLDLNNNAVRKVSPDGNVTTITGTGQQGFADGSLQTAQFSAPAGLAVDNAGIIYVGDQGNHRLRKIDLSGPGSVSTIAGTGAAGYTDGNTSVATFNYLTGLTVNASGEIFIADNKNHTIRKFRR